jgi:hypothetical protein
MKKVFRSCAEAGFSRFWYDFRIEKNACPVAGLNLEITCRLSWKEKFE